MSPIDAGATRASGTRIATCVIVTLWLHVASVAARADRVLAANEHGVWSDRGAALWLSISSRFHETSWFAWMGGLALLALAGAAHLWRQRLHRRHERHLEQTVAERTAALAREKKKVETMLARVEAQATRLRELDEAKTRFFANVSHELRTPLTLILGPLLDAERGDTAALRAEAPAMRRNALHLRRMIEQILALQKVEAGSLALRLGECDLRALVRQVSEVFAPFARRRDVRLETALPAGEAVARIDREQVERILGNLLSNAIKVTDPGGRVFLGLEAGEGGVRFRVADTGRGIPPEAVERVFDRFFQVDGTSTRARDGMGIGLALARELAELHGGSIEVRSALGEGSTFTVRLPRSGTPIPAVAGAGGAPAGASRESAPSEIEPPTSAGAPTAPCRKEGAMIGVEDASRARRRVLVVDDNDDLRAYLRRALRSRYAVLEAADGEAALAVARSELPDLVVSDVTMPKMDGLTLGGALRRDPLTAGIPFLFLTARAGEGDILAGFHSGAVAYVTKPFSATELMAHIEALMAQQYRLRQRLRAERAAENDRHHPGSAGREDAASPGPFEARLRAVIREHLHDDRFGVESLAGAVAASRPTIFRKLKREVGLSPAELLRNVRLERATELLADGEGTVSEIAYAVGFNTLAGFSRAYKRRYGAAPSAHRATVVG